MIFTPRSQGKLGIWSLAFFGFAPDQPHIWWLSARKNALKPPYMEFARVQLEYGNTHRNQSMKNNKSYFPLYGWIGLSLVSLFWVLNWSLLGTRTHWVFFPLWLGYCLTLDGLIFWRTGASLLSRSWRNYIGLFLVSAPGWWLFELLNLRTQNWVYLGADAFTPLQYAFWTTLSFTTVTPAVFESAEFIASFGFIERLGPGPIIATDKRTTVTFFVLGWGMLAVMLLWPQIFFPSLWLAIYFILEPVNVWLGNRSLAVWTQRGDWRPVISLWLGILLTAFFWEMWNFYAYPKWVYSRSLGKLVPYF